jgi:hypothetical protein
LTKHAFGFWREFHRLTAHRGGRFSRVTCWRSLFS